MLVKRDPKKKTTEELAGGPTVEELQSELHDPDDAAPPTAQSFSIGNDDPEGDDAPVPARPFAQRGALTAGKIKSRGPKPGSAAALAQVYGFDLKDLTLADPGLASVPNPPTCVMKKLAASEQGWRWMSEPTIKKFGNRGYTAYTVTDEDRTALRAGDCPPAVSVHVDNTLRWREDGILFVAPLRWIRLREVQRRLRVEQQNRAANVELQEQVRDLAGRVGAKFGANLQTWDATED